MKYVLITDANGMMIDPLRYKVDSGFMAATWTLQIREMNDMAWAVGNVVKSEDIRAFEGVAQLPCGPFLYPHVSLSNPNIVFFVVKELVQMEDKAGYDNTWIVAIDIRKNTLESSFQYIKWEEGLSPDDYTFLDVKRYDLLTFIPTEFPKFLKLNGTR